MGIVDALLQLAPFTAAQNGLFTSAQATQVGLDGATVHRLQARGLAEKLSRGVYALETSSRLTPELEEIYWRWLSIYPQLTPTDRRESPESVPVVMGHAAARLHGIGDLFIYEYEFSLPQKRVSRNQSFKFYKRTLPKREVTGMLGMKVTSIERTIADIARWGVCDYSHVAQMILDAIEDKYLKLNVLAPMLDDAARESSYNFANGQELLDLLLREAGLDIDSLAARLAVHTELADRIAKLRGSHKKRFSQEPVRDSRVAEMTLVAA